MRYRLPDGCAGIVHAGVALALAADRTIEAAEGAAAELAAHGLRPVVDSEPDDHAGTKPRPRPGRRGGGA